MKTKSLAAAARDSGKIREPGLDHSRQFSSLKTLLIRFLFLSTHFFFLFLFFDLLQSRINSSAQKESISKR
jgi:hypothetical protein